MPHFTITPRRGLYLINADDEQGQRSIVERYGSERQALQRLRELKAWEGTLYLEAVKEAIEA